MEPVIIKGYENYVAHYSGKIWSNKSGIFLAEGDNGNGYKKVNLYNPKHKQFYIHILIATAFVPNPHGYKYVDHIDRNKENNSASNLRWVTAKENTDNTAGKKRYSVSRKSQKSYTPEEIQRIKDEYNNGAKVMELSRKYKIPRQSISRFIKFS